MFISITIMVCYYAIQASTKSRIDMNR